jgi:hypothetical protein
VRYYKKRWGIETTFRVQDEVVFAVIELLGEKDILDDKGPPPDKIYEELIGKFGYIDGFSL